MSDPLQWPVASATPFRTSTDSSFKGVKIHLLDSQLEVEVSYSTQKMIQRTLQGSTQRIPHPWLMTDWKMINIFAVFLAQKNITRSCFVHSQKEKRKRDRIPHLWGSWIHASRAYGISKSRHRELARLLRQNHGEIQYFTSSQKAPGKNGSMHHWNPTP